MKITFIRPQFMNMQTVVAGEPLVFAILAGLTPPDVELDFLDERLEPIPDDHDTDLVALTVETFTARRAYQIATQFRQRGIPVVMGGYHPSFLPEEALVYADAVVIGDAEGVWGQLVQDARRGKLQRVYRDSKLPSLEGLKFDRSIFKGKRYKPFVPIVPVQYSRGCRFACEFCSIHAFYGSQTRQRPVAEVVAEIEALDRKYIIFIDDNPFVSIPKAEELFRALIPLNIRWGCQVSIDIAKNTHLLDLMAKSGCFGVVIGFESLNKENLRQMGKGWNLGRSEYDATIRKLRERGIMLYASFVFGYDHDTVDTFDITAEFAIRSGFALANFFPLNPMPGSRLYSWLMNENRLIYERWWLDPNYRFGEAMFHPRQMTADDLSEGCLRARKTFFGYRSILKRALDTKANSRHITHLGPYLVGNWMAKHVITYKQWHRLGADTPLEPRLENVPLQSIPSRELALAAVMQGETAGVI
jgi:radical SAM superfamily enzyme YgiQ (UPF0313 family)